MSGFYRRYGKRWTDLALSCLAAAALFPVIVLVSALIRIYLGRGVFFRQERAGRDGRIFRVVKFRSMSDARDVHGDLLPDDLRLPRFGQMLRRWSLDEIPQLWNVVRGDMSIVGPRPLFSEYLGRYNERQARRHEVRPGVTGWAQINGRNAISWEDRFELDVWYVENVSLLVDAKIIWLTLWRVVSGQGVSSEGHATMPKFMGTKSS